MVEAVGALILGAELAGYTLFTIGATSVTLGTVVGTVALTAGLYAANIGLSYLLAPRPGDVPGLGSTALPSPDASHIALRQAIPPRQSGYGRNRIAGSYVLYEAKDGNSYDIYALHHGKISAIVGYYLHDDVVEINSSGIVQEQADGRYGQNAITIKTRLGNVPETPYSEVMAAISEWTGYHRGDGIASAMLKCNSVSLSTFYTVYPRGKPELSVVADCLAIYDPRDGTQSRDNPSTWKVSSNPVLQIIDLLTNSDYGMGFDWDTLIAPVIDDLMTEANICDEPVALLAGGTEPRYRSNGMFPLDADDCDKLAAILDTCDGWLAQNPDGTLALKVGQYRAPSAFDAITAKHVRGFSLQFGVADEEVVNELTIDYTEPSLDYKTAPGQPWRDEADISERGKVRSQRFALPWVQSHAQARRLAKRRMAIINASLRGTLTTTLYGLRFIGERWIRVQAPELSDDLSDVVLQVQGATIDLQAGEVTFRFVRIDPNSIDAWDAANEEGERPEIPAKLVTPPPPIPANGSGFTFIQGGLSYAEISFDDTGRSDLSFQHRYRPNGSSDPFVESSVIGPAGISVSGTRQKYTTQQFFAGPNEMQLRSIGPSGTVFSDWSSSFVVS